MVTSTRDTTRIEVIIYALLLAGASAAMVIFAAADVGAAWKFAGTEQLFSEVAKGEVNNDLALDALTRSLRSSPNTSDLSRAAFVQLLRAQQLGIKSIRALPRLTASKTDLMKGLAAAPADAFAWTRLAVALYELNEAKSAANALAMALQLAPAERRLAAIHFDLGVVLWHELDRTTRLSLAQRLKWASQLPELKKAVSGNSAQLLRERLSPEMR